MSRGIHIVTDFSDYYDSLSDRNDPILTYKRNYNDSMPRDKALKFIRNLGIKTVELGTPRQFLGKHKKVVVYKDPNKHRFEEKEILEINHANSIYDNYLASPYYAENQGVTIKYLQVGTKRFRIAFKKDVDEILEGEITSIQNLEDGLNFHIQKPIFSLDYIYNGKEMVCVDYNEVQELSSIKIYNILTPEQVMEEIKKSMLAYNL